MSIKKCNIITYNWYKNCNSLLQTKASHGWLKTRMTGASAKHRRAAGAIYYRSRGTVHTLVPNCADWSLTNVPVKRIVRYKQRSKSCDVTKWANATTKRTTGAVHASTASI